MFELLLLFYGLIFICWRVFRFVEYGEYRGHLYGTSTDAVDEVVKRGRMCIVDVEPRVSFIKSQSDWTSRFWSRLVCWSHCEAPPEEILILWFINEIDLENANIKI